MRQPAQKAGALSTELLDLKLLYIFFKLVARTQSADENLRTVKITSYASAIANAIAKIDTVSAIPITIKKLAEPFPVSARASAAAAEHID